MIKLESSESVCTNCHVKFFKVFILKLEYWFDFDILLIKYQFSLEQNRIVLLRTKQLKTTLNHDDVNDLDVNDGWESD